MNLTDQSIRVANPFNGRWTDHADYETSERWNDSNNEDNYQIDQNYDWFRKAFEDREIEEYLGKPSVLFGSRKDAKKVLRQLGILDQVYIGQANENDLGYLFRVSPI